MTDNKKAYWCVACAKLRKTERAGATPVYYCGKLMQPIMKPADTGCSYFEQEDNLK